MKKWLNFFCLSFFSHKHAKEGAKRSYANLFLGLLLALTCLWAGFIGGDMLPFGAHYKNSPDFRSMAHSVFANANPEKRIVAEIENGVLKAKKQGGEYTVGLLVNTFENDSDKQNYSVNGYNVVVDTRMADTLAEIEAYALSSDGSNTVISYEDYLTLSDVAKLNFDFKLRYTGKELILNEESVGGYRAYVDGLSDENKGKTASLANELAEGKITTDQYNRAIYELYFVSYYPEITEYESTSKVPLLRNYYYHEYLSKGTDNYLFIFDDYLTGSFETKGGMATSFHGFYSDLEDGAVVSEGASETEAIALVDNFIKDSYKASGILTLYAYTMNIFSLVPFVVLMIMVVTLMTYSILKLRGTESIASLGAMLKIVGLFVWFSGVIAAIATMIMTFFVGRNMITVLPLVLFFGALAIRSIIFAIKESQLYTKQLELQEARQTEV